MSICRRPQAGRAAIADRNGASTSVVMPVRKYVEYNAPKTDQAIGGLQQADGRGSDIPRHSGPVKMTRIGGI